MAQVTGRGFFRQIHRTAPVRLAIALWVLFVRLPSSAADESLEYAVKATFLLNFTKFIEWPAGAGGDPGSPFRICVLGPDPFGSTLDRVVAGEVVFGRKVAVATIDREPAPGSCQILFFGDSEGGGRSFAGPGRGVLTVGEGEAFIRSGGMIGFVIENRRVRFEINRPAAQAAGLKLSSGLLAVAKSVVK